MRVLRPDAMYTFSSRIVDQINKHVACVSPWARFWHVTYLQLEFSTNVRVISPASTPTTLLYQSYVILSYFACTLIIKRALRLNEIN